MQQVTGRTSHRPREYTRPTPTLLQTCPELAKLYREEQEKHAQSRRDGLAKLRAAKAARELKTK